jgi:hypothetical protein
LCFQNYCDQTQRKSKKERRSSTDTLMLESFVDPDGTLSALCCHSNLLKITRDLNPGPAVAPQAHTNVPILLWRDVGSRATSTSFPWSRVLHPFRTCCKSK